MFGYTVIVNVNDNDREEWFRDGKRHCEDGPAVINHKTGYKEWWLNGVQYSEEEWKDKLNPAKEMTMAEIEAALGHPVKVIKGS